MYKSVPFEIGQPVMNITLTEAAAEQIRSQIAKRGKGRCCSRVGLRMSA